MLCPFCLPRPLWKNIKEHRQSEDPSVGRRLADTRQQRCRHAGGPEGGDPELQEQLVLPQQCPCGAQKSPSENLLVLEERELKRHLTPRTPGLWWKILSETGSSYRISSRASRSTESSGYQMKLPSCTTS